MNEPVAFATPKRGINRIPKNSMDKSTIVSVYPKAIAETKHTMQPSHFRIEAAEKDDFSILVVGCGSWLKEMALDQPFQEIYVGSTQIAQSFILDYSAGLLGYNVDQKPGLFSIPGAYDKKSIRKYINPETLESFDSLISKARDQQRRWFLKLVDLTDSLWARSNGNPLCVNEDSRMAARELGVNKDWMRNFQASQMENCKACGHMVNPIYPVCSNCKNIINPERAKELGLAFATVA